jgi:hypothetical protein
MKNTSVEDTLSLQFSSSFCNNECNRLIQKIINYEFVVKNISESKIPNHI